MARGPARGLPGTFNPAHGAPVSSYTFQEDVGHLAVRPVRCEDGVCRASGVKPVAHWPAMSLFGLAAVPLAAFLLVVGFSGPNSWERLFVGLPRVTGGVLVLAFRCLLVSGEAAEHS